MLPSAVESRAPGGDYAFGHALGGPGLGVGTTGDMGVDRAQVGLKHCSPGIHLERGAQRALDIFQRLVMDADGCCEYGHVAGQRLEHGEAEALALGGDKHGVGSVDP